MACVAALVASRLAVATPHRASPLLHQPLISFTLLRIVVARDGVRAGRAHQLQPRRNSVSIPDWQCSTVTVSVTAAAIHHSVHHRVTQYVRVDCSSPLDGIACVMCAIRFW